jgi:hypothetical protein
MNGRGFVAGKFGEGEMKPIHHKDTEGTGMKRQCAFSKLALAPLGFYLS